MNTQQHLDKIKRMDDQALNEFAQNLYLSKSDLDSEVFTELINTVDIRKAQLMDITVDAVSSDIDDLFQID